jgi:hypothetical protein
MQFAGHRDHLDLWAAKKVRAGGIEAVADYERRHNTVSIDGLPALDLPPPAVAAE